MTAELRYSFDVFDTVITRTVLRPKDVFQLMQQRLEAQHDGLPGSLPGCFWGARVWSEFLARRRSGSEDVTLFQIYQTLAELFRLDHPGRDRLLSAELALESEVLVPIDGALELVAAARRSAPVVFISDMYLPSEFIRGILERSALFAPGDRLYVSGELGKSKGSGRLFRHVLDDLKIRPGQLVHCGDNPVTDRLVPRRLEIGLHEGMPCAQPRFERLRGYAAMLQHFNDLRRARMQIGKVSYV